MIPFLWLKIFGEELWYDTFSLVEDLWIALEHCIRSFFFLVAGTFLWITMGYKNFFFACVPACIGLDDP
jgi:hypothetical protein